MISLANAGPDGCGKVEIFYNGSWGAVCATEWSNKDAQVVCRGLGLSGGNAYSGSSQVPGQPTWMDQVNCVGTEQRLEQCSSKGSGPHECSTYDAHICCSKVAEPLSPFKTLHHLYYVLCETSMKYSSLSEYSPFQTSF